jgi:hypothetical protein
MNWESRDFSRESVQETPVHPMTMDDIAEMRKDVDECAMVQLIEAWLGVDWYGCDIAEMRKDVDECAMVQLIEAWLGVDWYGCDIAER